MIDANLTGTYLTNADLTNADLTNASLDNANLFGVFWDNTTCPDATNSDNNDFTCCGHLNGAIPLAGCN